MKADAAKVHIHYEDFEGEMPVLLHDKGSMPALIRNDLTFKLLKLQVLHKPRAIDFCPPDFEGVNAPSLT